MILRTPRLTLRAAAEADVAAISIASSGLRVACRVGRISHPHPPEGARAFFASAAWRARHDAPRAAAAPQMRACARRSLS